MRGWWEAQVGAGRAIDPARHHVLAIDWLGADGVLDVPIDPSRSTTYEDDSITTPEERTKAFWQWDHLRLYGRDYPDKLRSVGFIVEERTPTEATGSELIRRHGLEVMPNFFCYKRSPLPATAM